MTTGSPETYADDARRYLLRSRIATGGMGEVWRATDTTLDREVAVKLLKTEYADDPSFRTRFETEARHAAALHHPNIASVYDFGEALAADGSGVPRPFLVMELVDGQPLSALLRPGSGLDPEPARDLLAQAADGLAVAHRAGIVHRDVKPANLLITPDRRLKITDFGIARASDGLGITQTGQVMGTPQYLSPEQARGETATPASDVYALGVVAFECLAGRRPFDKESPVATALAHLHDPVPDLPAAVPADLAGVVRRALAKDPAARYADGAAFAAALRDPGSDAATQVVAPVADPITERTQVLGAPVPAPVPPPTSTTAAVRPESTERRRTRWLVVLLLVLLGVVAVTAAVLATRGDDEPEPPTNGETVRVRESDFVGRPVEEVADELGDLGLEVTTTEVANPGGKREGYVSSVDPSGKLREGDEVEVSYWGAVPEEEPSEEPTESEEPSDTPTPTPTESEEPTESATPTPTPTPTPTESATPSESPTAGESQPATGASSPAAADTPETDREVAPR